MFFSSILYALVTHLVNWGQYWYESIGILLFGMLCAFVEKCVLRKISWLYFAFLIPTLLMLAGCIFLMNWIFQTGKINLLITAVFYFVFVFTFLLVVLKVKFIIPLFSFLGDTSLEIYLCQGLIFELLTFNKPLLIVFSMGLTLALAWLLFMLRKKVFIKK